MISNHNHTFHNNLRNGHMAILTFISLQAFKVSNSGWGADIIFSPSTWAVLNVPVVECHGGMTFFSRNIILLLKVMVFLSKINGSHPHLLVQTQLFH